MKIRRFPAFSALVLWVCSSGSARAWERFPAPDPAVVERAELIVVAHLKDASIVRVPHEAPNDGGTSEQHNATLIITEVLKGECRERELPVILHYGLRPSPASTDQWQVRPLTADRNLTLPNSRTAVYLYDIAEMMATKCSDDLRRDQIWFLRTPQDRKQRYWGSDSTDAPGLWFPEDIQPMDLKLYFQALLTEHPEDILRRYAGGDTPLALRSRLLLARRQLADVLTEPDPGARASRLVPLCLFTDEKEAGPTQYDALFELSAKCGSAGAARLEPIFEDVRYEAMQTGIMQRWAEAEYLDAIPLLIELLDTENQFWTVQTPAERDRLVNFHSADQPTPAQIRSAQRIQAILYAFQRLADPSTMAAILNTKLLWEKWCARADDRGIPQGCDAVLSAIRDKAASQR